MLAVAWFALLAPSSAAAEEFGIPPGGFTVRMLDAEGQPENRAGSHPDRLQVKFHFTLGETTARDIVIEMPPGLGGNLNAVPDCPRASYEEGVECPAESQVGVAKFGISKPLPIYQLEPLPGETVAFATKPGFALPLSMRLRPDDFGATFEATNPERVAVNEGEMDLWGVPADHQVGTTIPRRAFLTAPSRCGPVGFTLRARSWQPDAPWQSATAELDEPLAGCQELAFSPSLGVELGNPVADSPTSMQLEIEAPESEDPSQLANAQIKDASVTMPAGVTVSPSGAAGLVPCGDAEFGLGSSNAPVCPPSSRVGSVEMSSNGLREPLVGTIYLGNEHPGERFRLLVAVPAPGTVLKFTSALHPDLATGRLSNTLHDLPQASMQSMTLKLDGARPLLSSPLNCGSTSATATFTPYGGGPTVRSSAALFIAGRAAGGRCTGAPPFAPELRAGSVRPRAGRYSPFWTILRRRDGEQMPRQFSIELPAGFSASLGELKTCSEAEQIGGCPQASRMGSALLEAGSGPEPIPVRGGIYLTGPYRGAPFGMLMDLNAKVGSIDLGAMRIRAAMRVDERSGRVRVVGDALPALIEGVPIRFQSIELRLDRPHFIRNPTSCQPTSIDASIESQEGATVTASSPLVIRGCKALGFEPSIQIALLGKTGSRSNAKLGLRMSTRLRSTDSNLKTLRIAFPKALRLALSAVKEICSRQDAADGDCPARSKVGTATARTPMLNQLLRGSIFIVRPRGNGFPDLWVALEARGVKTQLSGTSSIHDGHFVTTLAGLPDTPLSDVTMRIGSSQRGTFSLRGDTCVNGHPRRFAASILARGQDGAERKLHPGIRIQMRCRHEPRAARR